MTEMVMSDFLQRIAQDADLRLALQAGMDAADGDDVTGTVVGFANEHGYRIDVGDMKALTDAFRALTETEISDSALETLSGGVFGFLAERFDTLIHGRNILQVDRHAPATLFTDPSKRQFWLAF